MQLPFISAIGILAVTIFLYLFVIFRDHRRRKGFPYPPGPPSLPVIGNLLDVLTGKESPWMKYASISKKYGRVHTHYYTIPFANVNTCIIRRRVLPSSFWTSHCGAELAICNQGPTREARRNTLRSAYVSHGGNVRLTVFVPTSFKLTSTTDWNWIGSYPFPRWVNLGVRSAGCWIVAFGLQVMCIGI
jgi:hypothetical protein